MNFIKRLFLLGVAICLYAAANAQIEVAHISSKGFSAIGYGGFLNLSIPVSVADAAIVGGGVFVFSNNDSHEAVAPVLAGYRHLLTGDDHGFYVEPVAGYTFGGTDIQAYDAAGNPLTKPDGSEIDRKVSGPNAGLGCGYLFEPSGPIIFNISLRYEHAFVTGGDPSLNIISLRISHSFSF